MPIMTDRHLVGEWTDAELPDDDTALREVWIDVTVKPDTWLARYSPTSAFLFARLEPDASGATWVGGLRLVHNERVYTGNGDFHTVTTTRTVRPGDTWFTVVPAPTASGFMTELHPAPPVSLEHLKAWAAWLLGVGLGMSLEKVGLVDEIDPEITH